jgi:hypothetical protein
MSKGKSSKAKDQPAKEQPVTVAFAPKKSATVKVAEPPPPPQPDPDIQILKSQLSEAVGLLRDIHNVLLILAATNPIAQRMVDELISKAL